MLCPRYDESSCQSYELLYHLIGPEKNVKSLKDSGWSPFLSKISSVFEVFLPMIPIQTLIRRLATKANISYYCWTLITSNQGWIEVLRMKKEGEKYRETQVSRTGATCPNQSAFNFSFDSDVFYSLILFLLILRDYNCVRGVKLFQY